MGWNTMWTRLLFGLGLPLVFLAPFTVWLVFPHVRTWLSKGDSGVGAASGGLASMTAEDLDGGEVILLERPQEVSSRLFLLAVQYATLQALRLLATMLAAIVLRRHLMVWKIFAPRFVFEAVGFLVSLGAVLAGYSLASRALSRLTKFYRGLDGHACR